MTDIPSLDVGTREFSGGRRVGQLSVTPEFAEAFAKMTPEEQQELVELATRNEIAEYYGGYAAFLDHEEIGPILRQAAKEGWAPGKLRYELERTNWWKQTSDAQRSWDGFVATNGGEESETVKRYVNDRAIELGDMSATLGVRLDDSVLAELARDSLRNGWTERDTRLAVANQIRLSPVNQQSLRTGSIGRELKDLAFRYSVPLSDAALDQWLNAVVDGRSTKIDFENYVKQQARSLYPSLVAEIDRGLDISTVVDPYRQVAMNTLGIPAEQVDFADPKWNAALNFDDGKGRRMMTLFEWGEHLRRDDRYGYDRTPQARNKAYQMVSDVGRMFGLTA